jgi:ATP-dependent DNA ligase
VKSRSATSARLPDFVEPMKAKLVDSMPTGDWIYEIKFDGYRDLALWRSVAAVKRESCPVTKRILAANSKK